MLHYLTAFFIQRFQHTLLTQANPSPNRIPRETVKTAPEINMGCELVLKPLLLGRNRGMILFAKEIQTEVYQLTVVLHCSLGPEGKEAAPPTDLRGELRRKN